MSGRIGWLIAAAAAVGYGLLWFGYAHDWGWIAAADDGTLGAAYGFGVDRPAWIGFWNVVSVVLGPTSLRVLAVVGIVVALVNRRRQTAWFLALTVLAMGLVTFAAKALVERPRPSTALTAAASSSFPSGHALGIVVGVLAFLTVLLPALAGTARVIAVSAGIAAVLLVGAARVALNVHHPSDVLAGWALGYLWFMACVTVAPPDLREPRPATR